MTMRPMGPSAMMAKIQELRAQFEPPQPTVPFQLPSHQPAPLSGNITSEGSYPPFNPFGEGAEVRSTMTASMLRPLIQRAAQKHDVDPDLLDALVQAESNYDPAAVSRMRAIGLTQLMPDTARELGVTNPFDPVQNLNGGAKYLSQMIKQFDGDLSLALAAYNAGPGAVRKHGGIPRNGETPNYVDKVLRLYEAKAGSR